MSSLVEDAATLIRRGGHVQIMHMYCHCPEPMDRWMMGCVACWLVPASQKLSCLGYAIRSVWFALPSTKKVL
eukprot:scaffold24926_cov66-Skeletonema_marinoi.AAC.1